MYYRGVVKNVDFALVFVFNDGRLVTRELWFRRSGWCCASSRTIDSRVRLTRSFEQINDHNEWAIDVGRSTRNMRPTKPAVRHFGRETRTSKTRVARGDSYLKTRAVCQTFPPTVLPLGQRDAMRFQINVAS